MKRKQLEMMLQRLRPLDEPSPELEQYPTPAHVAADVLWEAFSAGDISGKAVADLGCGNGVFCIGAKALGAERAVGVDADSRAVAVARENARSCSADVEIVLGDVEGFGGVFDTVVQNPPFGAQKRHADRPFIRKALELAPVAYSMHNEATQEFVVHMVDSLGGEARPVKRYKFEIPYAFEFHSETVETVSVVLLRFER